MAGELKAGDRVAWRSHGGTAHGTIERKLTADTQVNGHTARASADDPQYFIKSDKGGEAAHKPSALTRA